MENSGEASIAINSVGQLTQKSVKFIILKTQLPTLIALLNFGSLLKAVMEPIKSQHVGIIQG
jgi:hypothetical protein